jgi:AraC family transcriptional activator of pobA
MAKKSTADPSEFVSLFTFEELLRDVEFDLRVKEFVVMEIDKANYAIKLNTPYRSDYFCIFMVQQGEYPFQT